MKKNIRYRISNNNKEISRKSISFHQLSVECPTLISKYQAIGISIHQLSVECPTVIRKYQANVSSVNLSTWGAARSNKDDVIHTRC